jgi:hypothetical protein
MYSKGNLSAGKRKGKVVPFRLRAPQYQCFTLQLLNAAGRVDLELSRRAGRNRAVYEFVWIPLRFDALEQFV